MSNCNTCNTCSQPTRVCCCPNPAPTPAVPPVVICKSPIELLFEQTLVCFNETICDSPFDYIAEQALTYVVEDPADISLVEFLNEGTILSNCNLCCPKCDFSEGQLYVLSSVETFLKLYNNFSKPFSETCCLNIKANTDTYLKIKETFREFDYNACCNNFNEYVDELTNLTDCPNGIVSQGIIEYGSMTSNQESQVQNIALMIQAVYPTATPTEFCEYITRLLEIGLVVYCDENGVFIGSIESFSKYLESIL